MKSGTSLLRKLLSLHPNIFGGLETHWFSDDFVNHWKDPESRRQKWLLDFFDVTADEVAPARASSENAYAFFDEFMKYCTERAQKSRWVEKTPNNVFHVETINQLWPKAYILILKRDYKDVYASWKKNKNISIEQFMEAVLTYQKVLQEQAVQQERMMVVTYSDLVKSPKATLQAVLEFVGEAYIEGLENYSGDDTDYQKVLQVTGKESATTFSLQKPIFTSSIGQWEEILTPEEAKLIDEKLA